MRWILPLLVSLIMPAAALEAAPWDDERLHAAQAELERFDDPQLRLDTVNALADRHRYRDALRLFPAPTPSPALVFAEAALCMGLIRRDDALRVLDSPLIVGSPFAAAAARIRATAIVPDAGRAWHDTLDRLLAHRLAGGTATYHISVVVADERIDVAVIPGGLATLQFTCAADRLLLVFTGSTVAVAEGDAPARAVAGDLWGTFTWSVVPADEGGMTLTWKFATQPTRPAEVLGDLAELIDRAYTVSEGHCWERDGERWHGYRPGLDGAFPLRIDIGSDDILVIGQTMSAHLAIDDQPPVLPTLAIENGTPRELLEATLMPWAQRHANGAAGALMTAAARSIWASTMASDTRGSGADDAQASDPTPP